MKKVAIVTRKLVTGGVEKALINMLKEMDKEKYDITLYLMGRGGELEKELPQYVRIKNIYWEESSFKELFIKDIKRGKVLKSLKTLKYSIKSIWSLNHDNYFKYEYFLSKIIDKPQEIYDLVISYHAPATFPVIYSIDFIKSRKSILWIHGDTSACKKELENYIEYYNKYDKIFCISNSIKNKLLEEYPFLESKTEVFYNIIDEDDVNKQSTMYDVFKDDYKGMRLLTVGRIDDEKGQLIIPEVVKLLKENNVDIRWYCIGEGPLEDKLITKIEDYGLKEDIILLGKKDNPYPYFRNCDIYVQTSKHEGYGLTINEAKILNKPIITTNTVGGLEQIINNYNGLVVEYDEIKIYNAIKRLVNNKSEIEYYKNRLHEENNDKTKIIKKQMSKIDDILKII